MCVLVLDSGIGGLNVLRRLVAVRRQHYVYVADQAFCPYGVRTATEVASRVAQIAGHLGCSRLVLACNTAACAVDACQTVLPVPCVDAVHATCDYLNEQMPSSVALLATTLTVRSDLYRRLLDRKIVVNAFAADKLVELAECEPCGACDVENVPCGGGNVKGALGGAMSGARSDVVAQMSSGALAAIRKSDAVVLGCTHFDYFAEQIATLLPRGCRLVSSSDCLAKRAAAVLPDAECARIDFYTTDKAAVQKTSDLTHRCFEYLHV